MTRKTIVTYALGIMGVILSYIKFFEWFSLHGFHIVEGWTEGFTASLFATGFVLDLVACTMIVLTLAILDHRKLGFRWVIAIFVSTIVFSVSLGLAFYLVRIQQANAKAN